MNNATPPTSLISDAEWAEHKAHWTALAERAQRYAGMIFVVTFAGYGAAIWSWWQGSTWLAIIIATCAYLFFRQFRRFSLRLALRRVAEQPAARPAADKVEALLEQHGPEAVMAAIQARLTS